jgi:hypothetical protein
MKRLPVFFGAMWLLAGVASVAAQICPTPGGTQQPRPKAPGQQDSTEVISAYDPNEIIGPAGQPTQRWVSINDRLPYTITFENDKSASAPAKFVRIVAPIHPNMDPATFQLGNLGFNNQTFEIPTGTASYYQRLDCRDSLGLFVDLTAGYDVQNNQAFWELQSIDPTTLLPPADPLKGLLLLQDSTRPNDGHGFANFSVKPVGFAHTRDLVLAGANIIFDANTPISTNEEQNTIDAAAPSSQMATLPGNSSSPVLLSWSGQDDANGCGLQSYALYVSADGANYSLIRSGITRTDTSFEGQANKRYYFFVLATDSVGNTELLRPGQIQSTFIGATLPLNWLYFTGVTQGQNNLLQWATVNEQNTASFEVERSITGSSFTKIGRVAATGRGNGTYQLIDHNIHKLNSSVMYYRVKQTDQNGAFTYSAIIRLSYKPEAIVSSVVYPNPTTGVVTLALVDAKLLNTAALVLDANGKTLQSVKISSQNQAINLGSYTSGVYFIKFNNHEVLRVVKQ